ncbi:helix-turn-helix domain-containing protein [Kitasatospora purpeofusca]|uniref:helix-turn-helix domain-containing protein n=1 Tax=Kitasatospora purpeofusca TaxID=67352 RepID=UPI003F4AD18C
MITRLAGARKARTVALSWAGLRVVAIAAELGCRAKVVRWWLHRFNGLGLEGLDDRPITGRPRRLTEFERSRIIALVKQAPPGRPVRQEDGVLAPADGTGPPEWTLDALAGEAGRMGIAVGRSQVRRMLLAEGVCWRRTRSWTRSKDVDFEEQGRGSSACTPARPTARGSCAPTSSGR